MAITNGYVQRLTSLSGPTTCVWVGPDPATNELLTIISPANESAVDRANKHVMTEVLAHMNDARVWDDAGLGEPVDWDKLFAGYGAEAGADSVGIEPARSFAMTFSQVSALAPGASRFRLSRSSPPVFNRVLWQLRQY